MARKTSSTTSNQKTPISDAHQSSEAAPTRSAKRSSTISKPTTAKVVTLPKAGTAKRAHSTKVAATKSTSRARALSMKSNTQPSPRKEAKKKGASGRTRPTIEPAPPAVEGNGDLPTLEQLRKVKTGLTKKDLAHFEKLLFEKRAEIIGDVETLQVDVRNGGGSISYEHMADVGTDSYEQEFALTLVQSERKLLREIDEALIRIREGIYGVCVEAAQPIGKPRLEAKPWAKYCIEVAREREKRGLL